MENDLVIINLIKTVGELFDRYNMEYMFEWGVIYNIEGEPIEYDVEELKADALDIIDQLKIDCNNSINNKDYQKARNCIMILEMLNNILILLENNNINI